MKIKKTLITNQNGGAAVEFGIILPLFILVLFGIIEFGLLLYNQQVITNACREGARAGIVMRVPRLNNDQIEAVVRQYAQNHLVTFGNGTFDPPTITPDMYDRNVFGTDLTVSVTYKYDFLIFPNLMELIKGNFTNNIILQAQTIMKME